MKNISIKKKKDVLYRVFVFILIVFCSCKKEQEETVDTIFVDEKGVMRWERDKSEASFFGVNYTLPFAHGYRAAQYQNVDIKKAIDKDVYHMARLGFNAYRIHIWDVEVSDSVGHLLNNEHLELLDYLLAKLEERQMYTLITAQTNFGNGYPERNTATRGFSYKYEKCDMHSNPTAIEEQKTYLSELLNHVNLYTGKTYRDDPYIVGVEINNEPCHTTSVDQVKTYINAMVDTLKSTGFTKPVFYNVSHNEDLAQAYFDADIDGTTYQWYPIGLVKGRMQKGNFLPYVEEYTIPYANLDGFGNKAKAVYEFDPADILYSHMIPAMTKAFRTAGFQWITQFAYDAMDIAWANTEYQTHFLNLAYTPNKAISMKISKEISADIAMYQQFGDYPQDTVFGDFRVSYKQDLSEMNTESKFYHSNTTQTKPKANHQLESIAGVGSSPIVQYPGTGAYFIDKIEEAVWRLEIMPDILITEDPFSKTSLNRRVAEVMWNKWNMTLDIENLGSQFEVEGINAGNNFSCLSTKGIIKDIQPGVYLLKSKKVDIAINQKWGQIHLNEYAAPKPTLESEKAYISHQETKIIEKDNDLEIRATIASLSSIDSVLIYTDKVSFWNDNNVFYKMTSNDDWHFRATIPKSDLDVGIFQYNIVVFGQEYVYCFPQKMNGTPLDWDCIDYKYYQTSVVRSESLISLYDAAIHKMDIDLYSLPKWSRIKSSISNSKDNIDAQTYINAKFETENEADRFYLKRYVKDEIIGRLASLEKAKYIIVRLNTCPEDLEVTLIDSEGYTYGTQAKPYYDGTMCKVPIASMKQMETALVPIGYPSFVNKKFSPSNDTVLDLKEVEAVQLSFGKENEIKLSSIYIQ